MGKMVLVVDDSMTIRQLVSAVLEPEGFETLEAIDGVDALSKISKWPDIVLVMCDVNMPGMNGLDMVAIVRKHGSNVPFVMLTTEAQPDLLERAKSLGVRGWMLKPVKPQLLVAAVKALIGPAGRTAGDALASSRATRPPPRTP
jgi:two-component system chemotaxis response regulator CheY